MTDQQIFELVSIFRNTIDEVRNQGYFQGDLTFWHFPRGCDSDTCIAEIDKTRCTARDLTRGLVIDITDEQFGDPAVYVGNRNDFYRRYRFSDAHIRNEIAAFLP